MMKCKYCGGNLTLEQPTEEGYTKAFCIKIKQVEEKPYELQEQL